MRPLTAFGLVLGVVALLATGMFFAVSWFSFSDLGNIPAQVGPVGPSGGDIGGGSGGGGGGAVQMLTAQITTPASGASFAVGDTVSFQGSASGGTAPYTYSWNLGEGSSGNGSRVDKVYSNSGNFTITLTVTDSATPVHTATAQVAITINAAPKPFNITITNPATGASFTTGQTINFTSSAVGGSGSYDYAWTFGDGTSASTANASKSYTQANTFTVSLEVTDRSTSQRDTYSIQITISFLLGGGGGGAGDPPDGNNDDPPTINDPLEAQIDSPSNNSIFQTGQTVNFSGSGSGGETPYRYRWNFGDGTTATTRTPSKSYTAAGSRTVSLQVIDDEDVVDSATINITIQTPPPTNNPPDGGNPGGGGGGGGGGNNNPPPAPPVVPPVTPVTTCVPTSGLPPLTGPLSIGWRDNPQVIILQKYLANDRTIYPEGIISGFYGPLTRAAVQRFQIKYGILTPASDPELLGFAGPVTRAKITQVLSLPAGRQGGGTSCPVSTTPTTPAPTPVATLTPEQRAALAGQLNTFVSSFRQNLVSWLVNLGSFLTP